MEKYDQGYGSFLLQLLKSRWMMAVVSFYILFCSGATYIFGIYSSAIKSALHYDQETIDTLSFYKDLGANVGIISGLMNEVLPAWTVLAVGAGMNLFGYLMIWLAVTHRIAQPPLWQMNLFLCIGANSQTFANTGVLVTFVKNFPQGRGEVLGIVKGCVGLSGAIFTQIYHAIYGQDTTGVILLIAWLPSFITLVFMFFIRLMPPITDKREKRTFYSFLCLALLLAAFLMLAIVVENELKVSSLVYKAMASITVILIISNVIIGVHAQYGFMAQLQQRQTSADESSTSTRYGKKMMMQELSTSSKKQLLQRKELASASPANTQENHGTTSEFVQGEHQSKKGGVLSENAINLSTKPKLITKFKIFLKNWPERGEDFTVPQAIFSVDMWILFISITSGMGATLTAIDNMGQIGESLGYSKVGISTFISLISIWNFLGRVIAGFVSEILLRRYCFPRTLMLTIVLGLACIGHLLIAFPAPGTLYIASIMVGLCFGAQWPLLFAIISELFGLKYYATLHNVGSIASPLGSYLLNVRVAGLLYDREARRQAALLISDSMGAAASALAPSPAAMVASTGDLSCVGSQCFKLTFLIMTMVSAFGSLVSSILVIRTRKFYSQDIYAKFRLKSDTEENQCENGQ